MSYKSHNHSSIFQWFWKKLFAEIFCNKLGFDFERLKFFTYRKVLVQKKGSGETKSEVPTYIPSLRPRKYRAADFHRLSTYGTTWQVEYGERQEPWTFIRKQDLRICEYRRKTSKERGLTLLRDAYSNFNTKSRLRLFSWIYMEDERIYFQPHSLLFWSFIAQNQSGGRNEEQVSFSCLWDEVSTFYSYMIIWLSKWDKSKSSKKHSLIHFKKSFRPSS